MTDFRALCAELVPCLQGRKDDEYGWPGPDPEQELLDRARAALAQAKPEGPTDEELLCIAAQSIEPYDQIRPGEYEAENNCAVEVYGSELIAFARAVLARWGRPAPQATVKDCLTDQPTDTQVAQLVRMLGDLAAEAELADQTRDVFVLDRAINMLKRLSLPQPS